VKCSVRRLNVNIVNETSATLLHYIAPWSTPATWPRHCLGRLKTVTSQYPTIMLLQQSRKFTSHFISPVIRPHPMHEMRPIATDDPVAWRVCQSVSQSVCLSVWYACKNASTDRGPVWAEDFWGPRNIVLGGGPYFRTETWKEGRGMGKFCLLYIISGGERRKFRSQQQR